MGLTLIRKSQEKRRKRNPKVALVLAGGAVSGGAFKVGGLKALDDFMVGRKITDLDLYVGLSAGSILAVSLAGGITPDEMLKVLEGTSGRFKQLGPNHFYRPNIRDFLTQPAKFAYEVSTYLPRAAWEVARGLTSLPEAVGPALRAFARKPSYTRAEAAAMAFNQHIAPSREVPSAINHVPTGFFDNSGLEKWLRENLARIRMPNEFAAFEERRGRRLYLSACDLDTAERVIFGADEHADATISQAVQASTALPIFYKPARIGGVDYIDGGVRHTANIDVAIEKGADLIICYNPFRPFLNRVDEENDRLRYYAKGGRYMSDRGLLVVLNQVFRTLLHSRLKLGLQRYLTDDRFLGDIVLLEPREHDLDFFEINPLAFWRRADAIRHGFDSVRTTIEQNFDQLEPLFRQYGIGLDRAAAKRRARRVRSSRGWKLTEPEVAPKDERRLRLVRA
ncbi:MAG: patatin-like phospholipase family protein [Myxococcales bacterium]|nr:patatin-like phospholipase family protein [Myxococcales bacterium]